MKKTPLQLELLLLGISQAEVARKAQVHPSYVCRVLRRQQKPSPKLIRALARFGVEVNSYGW